MLLAVFENGRHVLHVLFLYFYLKANAISRLVARKQQSEKKSLIQKQVISNQSQPIVDEAFVESWGHKVDASIHCFAQVSRIEDEHDTTFEASNNASRMCCTPPSNKTVIINSISLQNRYKQRDLTLEKLVVLLGRSESSA